MQCDKGVVSYRGYLCAKKKGFAKRKGYAYDKHSEGMLSQMVGCLSIEGMSLK